MFKDKQSMVLIVLAFAIIPLVHWIAPMFFLDTPRYVSTGEGSIIGKGGNIYLQLLPYLLAYLSAPAFFIWGLVRLRRQRKSSDSADA